MTHMVKPKEDPKKAFAMRLNDALDDVRAPAKGSGRQNWVKAYVKKAGITASQVAVRKWLEGEGYPDVSKISALSELLDVRVEWLLFGTGTKTRHGDPVPLHVEVLTTTDPHEIDMIRTYRVLTKDGRKFVDMAYTAAKSNYMIGGIQIAKKAAS